MNFLTLDLKIFTLSEQRISKGSWFHKSVISRGNYTSSHSTREVGVPVVSVPHRRGHSLSSLIRLSLSLCCTKAVFNMAVGYFEGFCSIWHHCWIEWKERGPRKTFLKDFINELSVYGFISVHDILLCLLLGVFFTFLRHVLTVAVFKVRFDFNCLILLLIFYH